MQALTPRPVRAEHRPATDALDEHYKGANLSPDPSMADERLSTVSSESPDGRPWRLILGDARHSEVDELLPVGTDVKVKTQYLGSWTSGFVIAAQLEHGYRLRRVSDGSEVPGEFDRADVRPAVDLP